MKFSYSSLSLFAIMTAQREFYKVEKTMARRKRDDGDYDGVVLIFAILIGLFVWIFRLIAIRPPAAYRPVSVDHPEIDTTPRSRFRIHWKVRLWTWACFACGLALLAICLFFVYLSSTEYPLLKGITTSDSDPIATVFASIPLYLAALVCFVTGFNLWRAHPAVKVEYNEDLLDAYLPYRLIIFTGALWLLFAVFAAPPLLSDFPNIVFNNPSGLLNVQMPSPLVYDALRVVSTVFGTVASITFVGVGILAYQGLPGFRTQQQKAIELVEKRVNESRLENVQYPSIYTIYPPKEATNITHAENFIRALLTVAPQSAFEIQAREDVITWRVNDYNDQYALDLIRDVIQKPFSWVSG